MAAALQAATRIDRLLASQAGGAGFGPGSALAGRAKPHGFGLVQFAIGGGVVQFGQIDIRWAHTGHGISLTGQPLPDVLAVQLAIGPGPQHRGADLDRACVYEFFQIGPRADDGRGRPVAHGCAHGAGERIGHRFVGQHLGDGHIGLILGHGVERSVEMVLGTDDGQLPLGGPEAAHVPAGAHGIGVHEDAAPFAGGRLVRRDLDGERIAHPFDHLDMGFEVTHIHAKGIRAQREGFVGIGDLLRSHRQGHIIHSRADAGIGHVQGG